MARNRIRKYQGHTVMTSGANVLHCTGSVSSNNGNHPNRTQMNAPDNTYNTMLLHRNQAGRVTFLTAATPWVMWQNSAMARYVKRKFTGVMKPCEVG